MLKEIKITNGLRVRKAYVEDLNKEPQTGSKAKARYEIQEQVYEALADSVADNAKMISLVFAMGSAIYSVLTDSMKNNLDDATRDKIEYAIDKYHSVETWGDIQLATEGNEAINKLLDRQAKIGSIIKEIYG